MQYFEGKAYGNKHIDKLFDDGGNWLSLIFNDTLSVSGRVSILIRIILNLNII